MRYIPKLSNKEIEENHKCFSERVALYKKKGLDFAKNREFILKMARPLQGRILDMGTGTGHTSLALGSAGYEFTSIDNDKNVLKIAALNLAYAKVLSNVEFYMVDGNSMDFENGSFRNIVSVNLVHHIDEISKMFTEMDRVLCANGKVILSDFNKKGMKMVNAVHRKEGHAHKDSGVTKDSVSSFFRDLGYKLNEHEDKYHWILIGEKK